MQGQHRSGKVLFVSQGDPLCYDQGRADRPFSNQISLNPFL